MVYPATVYIKVNPQTPEESHYWNFDETSGTNLVDVEGNADAVTTNGAVWVSGRPDHGSALSFTATNQFARTVKYKGSSKITVSAWIKPSSTTNNIGIIRHSQAFDFIYKNGKLGVAGYWNDGTRREKLSDVAVPLSTNEWNFVAASFGDGKLKFYLNGQLVSSKDWGDHPNARTSGAYIGGFTGFPCDAVLDDIREYNHVLTDAEIAKIYYDNKEGTGMYPVANPDSVSTVETIPITIHPLANDTDPDGDTLQFIEVLSYNAEHATVTANTTNGTVFYQSTNDFVGTDHFIYSVTDGHGNTSVGEVTVQVNQRDPKIKTASSIFAHFNSGESGEIKIPVGNIGLSNNLVLSQPTLSGADAAQFTVLSYDSTIAPNSTGTVTVAFASPNSNAVNYQVELSLPSNDAVKPLVTVPIDVAVVNAMTNSLYLYYGFEEGSGTTADDLINPTADNQMTFKGTHPERIGWGAGKVGHGSLVISHHVNQDVHAYLPVTDMLTWLPPTNQVTLSCWFRFDACGNYVSKIIGMDSTFIFGVVASSKKPYFQIGSNKVEAPKAFVPGEWCLLTGTYDGTTIRFYVNGEEVGSKAVSLPNWDVKSGSAGVASKWENARWSIRGAYDDIRLYDRALFPDEVASLTNATPPVIENRPPQFTADPITVSRAIYAEGYTNSIANMVTDPNDDPLTFAKVSGPAWLNVATNGVLTGTPDTLGLNTFVVSVSDGQESATATLKIKVFQSAPRNDICDEWALS